jgi:hypothetical protein
MNQEQGYETQENAIFAILKKEFPALKEENVQYYPAPRSPRTVSVRLKKLDKEKCFTEYPDFTYINKTNETPDNKYVRAAKEILLAYPSLYTSVEYYEMKKDDQTLSLILGYKKKYIFLSSQEWVFYKSTRK